MRFFRVNGGSAAEKSWLACAACAGVVALPRIPVRFARAVELKFPGDFFCSLLMLCYCVFHVLKHFVHWNWCITAMCSTVVCCNSLVFCNAVFEDRSGMLLCFAAESCKSYCNGCMTVLNCALTTFFCILALMIFL